MKLISVNIGLPRTVNWRGGSVTTGIFKEPIDGSVMLRALNLDGDRQADLSVHGGIDGMIRWVNASLNRATGKTIIVPGHGPVGNRAQLVEFRDMLVAIREKVSRLKKQGKSLDEVIAAKPTSAYDAKWGNFVIDPVFFTRLVYAGV